MAKARDHAAEYARSKQLAASRGYVSQRKRKAAAPAVRKANAQRQRKSDTQRLRRATLKSTGFGSVAALNRARREAAQWSVAHSQQRVSMYSADMPAQQFGDYYRAFVADWGQERSRDSLNYYLDTYPGEWEPPEHDWPY